MLIKARVVPISVITPLSPQPMIHLLRITKRCLDNNFLSSLVTLAGAVIVLHYEDVLGIQDECPLVLCFSPSPGSGIANNIILNPLLINWLPNDIPNNYNIIVIG